jgi:hypothetical protein
MVEKGRLEVEGGADVQAPSVGDWERGVSGTALRVP